MTDRESAEDERGARMAGTGAGPPAAQRTGTVVAFPGAAMPHQVAFDRHELREILDLYGRMVAQGEWRDYAIDFRKDCAVFSIFRRASEMPLFRIVKDPRLARRQGVYAVIAATGLVLKRGHELARVLRVLDKPVRLVN